MNDVHSDTRIRSTYLLPWTKAQPSSRLAASQSSVSRCTTDSGESCASPALFLDHLSSSASAVISTIVAGNLSQVLPVEQDDHVAPGPRLTGSSLPALNPPKIPTNPPFFFFFFFTFDFYILLPSQPEWNLLVCQTQEFLRATVEQMTNSPCGGFMSLTSRSRSPKPHISCFLSHGGLLPRPCN